MGSTLVFALATTREGKRVIAPAMTATARTACKWKGEICECVRLAASLAEKDEKDELGASGDEAAMQPRPMKRLASVTTLTAYHRLGSPLGLLFETRPNIFISCAVLWHAVSPASHWNRHRRFDRLTLTTWRATRIHGVVFMVSFATARNSLGLAAVYWRFSGTSRRESLDCRVSCLARQTAAGAVAIVRPYSARLLSAQRIQLSAGTQKGHAL